MRKFCLVFLGVVLAAQLAGVVPALAQELSGGEPRPGPASAAAPAGGAAAPEPGPAPSVGSFPAVTGPAEAPELDPTTLGIVILSMLIGGLVLLFIEVALIPGFGLTGVTGIVVILAGMGLAFWKLELKYAVMYTMLSFVALIALVLWAIYVFPYTSLGRKFRLETKISVEDGYTAIRDMSRFVGQEGVATSDLRPSGIARVGDERIDVISDGEFIPRGTRIKVVKEKSGNLIVIPLDPPGA